MWKWWWCYLFGILNFNWNRWWQSNHVINDDRVVWGEGEYEVGVGRIIGVVKRVLPDLTRHDRTLDLSLTTSFSSITSTTIMRYSMNRCGDCAVDGDLSNLPLLSNATRSVRVQGTDLWWSLMSKIKKIQKLEKPWIFTLILCSLSNLDSALENGGGDFGGEFLSSRLRSRLVYLGAMQCPAGIL